MSSSDNPAGFIEIETQPDGTEILHPTSLCRGPWDADSCHAGPPNGAIARAAEQALPGLRLVRLTTEIMKPIPMAGFTLTATVTKPGRTVATSRIELRDLDEELIAVSHSAHLASRTRQPDIPTISIDPIPLEASTPGPFVLDASRHGSVGFIDGVETRYPDGHDNSTGPTSIWLRTVPIFTNAPASGFQQICPLADCGNAISRNGEPLDFGFMNTDLSIHLHREPIGEWFRSEATSYWSPDGIGMADALLYDEQGPVGRAVQSLVISPM
ncbi:MAG: thioesterase family protein [Actinomycetota bacterium]|nr:thioesterase family protein [Actinomycetota bacterium]